MPAHPSSRTAAEARYGIYRSVALARAEALFAPSIAPTPVRFRTITGVALDAWRLHWARHPARQVAWPWDVMVPAHRRRHPTRFELAVWSGDALCGLAIGRAGVTHCSLEYLEGSPIPDHPLRRQVIPAALATLLAYATVLGKSEMRLVEPLDALVPAYEARGFMLVEPPGERRYCVRTVL